MSPRVSECGEVKSLEGRSRRETECEMRDSSRTYYTRSVSRSNLGQDEVGVKPHGGPNVSVLKNGAMT